MSDNKFREEYQSIKAPSELYGRIVNTAKTEVRGNTVPFRKLAAAAAAFAVILLAGVFLTTSYSAPGIYVGDRRLTGEVELTQQNAQGIMLARSGNAVTCEFTFELDKKTLISVSDGVVSATDGTVLLDGGEEKEFSGTLQCKWTVMNADENTAYEMKLTDKKKTYLITLSFDSIDGQWTAMLTE